MFTPHELKILDAPTADSDIVLASLGGKPHISGGHSDDKGDSGDSSTKSGSDSLPKDVDSLSATERGEGQSALRERRPMMESKES